MDRLSVEGKLCQTQLPTPQNLGGVSGVVFHEVVLAVASRRPLTPVRQETRQDPVAQAHALLTHPMTSTSARGFTSSFIFSRLVVLKRNYPDGNTVILVKQVTQPLLVAMSCI